MFNRKEPPIKLTLQGSGSTIKDLGKIAIKPVSIISVSYTHLTLPTTPYV